MPRAAAHRRPKPVELPVKRDGAGIYTVFEAGVAGGQKSPLVDGKLIDCANQIVDLALDHQTPGERIVHVGQAAIVSVRQGHHAPNQQQGGRETHGGYRGESFPVAIHRRRPPVERVR
jgi:hypothetical protein